MSSRTRSIWKTRIFVQKTHDKQFSKSKKTSETGCDNGVLFSPPTCGTHGRRAIDDDISGYKRPAHNWNAVYATMQHTVHSSLAIPESPLLPLLQCGPTSAAIPRLVSIWSILACHGRSSPGRRFSLDSCSSSLQPSAQTPSKGTNLLYISFLSISFLLQES